MAEFDAHTDDYKTKLAQSLGVGEQHIDQFARYKIAKLAEYEGHEAAGSLLDFGCGVGLSLPHIANLLPNITPIMADQSADSLQQLSRKNFHQHTVVQIGQDIPIEDNALEAALASCVFHHIPPKERVFWLSELRRTLQPGASLYIFEHNPLNPVTQLIVKRSPLDTHAQLLTCKTMRNLCAAAGFKTVHHEYLLICPPSWSINTPLEKLFHKIPIGAQYLVRAVAAS